MRDTEVGHVMTTEVVTAAYDTSSRDVARALKRHGISGLPVVDDDEQVIGVISGSDLPPHVPGAGRRARRTLTRLAHGHGNGGTGRVDGAGSLMSAPAITVRASSSIAEAARWMAQRHVERLPVVDEESRLVGMVTRRDLLQVFLRPDREIEEAVARGVFVEALGLPPEAVAVDVRSGVVTLEGDLERRAEKNAALCMTRQVDGVVAVVDRLTCPDGILGGAGRGVGVRRSGGS